ncbi:MAG: cation diffusion facilitator family transporter [bacterium]
MDRNKQKKQAALISIISNFTLIVAKFITGFLIGSFSIISESIHSFTDLLASFLAYYSIKKSSEPADIDHPYGHGKFEDISALFEGLLLFAATVYIIYEALNKIKHGVSIQEGLNAGIYVMAFSCVVNICVSRHLYKVGKKTDSIALLADAKHLSADVWTSFGVLGGLVLIKLTKIPMIDPIIAIIIALMIAKSGYGICKTAIGNLLDSSLPEEDNKIIREKIKVYMPKEIVEIRSIKTRKSGSEKLIDLILVLPSDITLKDGHDLCDVIENELMEEIKNSVITIHLEPCNKICEKCGYLTYHGHKCSDNNAFHQRH